MLTKFIRTLFSVFIVACTVTLALQASTDSAFAHEVRLELGGFKTVSNRFNIPNPGGSRISVDEDGLNLYGRAQLSWQLSDNGFLRLMLAPLSADYGYRSVGTTVFHGQTFAGNTDLQVHYRFNSYRLGYIYRFPLADNFRLQVGGVGKVRDAEIRVSAGSQSSSYKNVGFVPLLNVGFLWKVLDPWELRFDLDGAAAPQGRAFDGSLEVFRGIGEAGSGFSAGVRILEGGADNEKVNTFALVDYAFLGYTQGF